VNGGLGHQGCDIRHRNAQGFISQEGLAMRAATTPKESEITISVAGIRLPGTLTLPDNPSGVVVFAHGSGSSRLSPRNRLVARWLNDQGCGTLLFDLLTDEEAAERGNVFDIELLAGRMRGASDWLRHQPQAKSLPIGYFGASTGAAAALVAAADAGESVAAVVSRGGRPDLAGAALPRVSAPTLLIVGSLDDQVLQLNRQAQQQMRVETRIAVVPGATHLFEERGTLEEVARLAASWFVEKFAAHGTRRPS
jgi:putative phosphoribosyl transferase